MAQSKTAVDLVRALTAAQRDELRALLGIASSEPVKPAANAFVQAMRERAAAKLPCEIHPAERCNRRFSPASSGRRGHVARVE
jgi:hypothetical protein